MLARQALRRNALYQSRVLLRPNVSRQRRTYLTEILAPMANQVIDLSLALPWPADWPPYASTIILLALIQRTALLPIALWVRRRTLVWYWERKLKFLLVQEQVAHHGRRRTARAQEERWPNQRARKEYCTCKGRVERSRRETKTGGLHRASERVASRSSTHALIART